MRSSRAIRAGAWGLVIAGAAAPVIRRRRHLPKSAVMVAAALTPPALVVAAPRGRWRTAAVCCLNGWAYLAAYELPHDDPEAQLTRVHFRYPVDIDRVLGLGTPPTIRLQRRFSDPRTPFNHLERTLVFCHWAWFLVPHCTVVYVGWRRPDRFASAAARMYAVFDIGAVFYWAIPTAPPWYAARAGHMGGSDGEGVRRMMIEFGEEFWGDRWPALMEMLGGNPLAAMPSLHFATSLMAAHLLAEVGPISGAVGSGYAGCSASRSSTSGSITSPTCSGARCSPRPFAARRRASPPSPAGSRARWNRSPDAPSPGAPRSRHPGAGAPPCRAPGAILYEVLRAPTEKT